MKLKHKIRWQNPMGRPKAYDWINPEYAIMTWVQELQFGLIGNKSIEIG
jgi:hypothetical protein